MTDKGEFIEFSLKPFAGTFVNEFDWNGVFDEVAEYDPYSGFVWREEYEYDDDAYYEVLMRHEWTKVHPPRTVNGITYELFERDEDQSFYLVSFTLANEFGDDPLTIAVLVDNDDGPQTTSDWRESQPNNIEECQSYDLVRCSDLLVRDGIGDDAKAVLRAIIDELEED